MNNYTGIEIFNLPDLSKPEPMEKEGPTLGSTLDMGGDAGASFKKMLEKLGLNSEGIAMNEIGKAQLLSRLQKVFGDSYLQDPMALDAVAAFDKEVEKFPMDSKKSAAKMISSGQRTLKELLKG
jgi:hypothetical protein